MKPPHDHLSTWQYDAQTREGEVDIAVFSRRLKLRHHLREDPIKETAPEPVRRRFWELLKQYLHVDHDSRYNNPDAKPIGAKSLYQELTSLAGIEPEPDGFDSWYCYDVLEQHIIKCEWEDFYDGVDVVAKRLFETTLWREFHDETNKILAEENVWWRLDEKGQLGPPLPKYFSHKIASLLDEQLGQDEFAPARRQFMKARRFLEVAPVDPENSIKEAVSSLESAAKILCPKSKSTLGEVLKEWKRKKRVPKLLVEMLEKYWGFATSAPLVRHGSSQDSNMTNAEAEFCIVISAAAIKYLIDTLGQKE